MEDIVDNVVVMYGGHVRSSGRLDSLLKEEKKHSLTFESSDEKLVERIRDFVKKELGNSVNLEHPKRSLEDMFLEVIRGARKDSITTSGAEYSGKVAEYLQESNHDILDKLTKAEVPEEFIEKPTSPELKAEVLDEVLKEDSSDEVESDPEVQAQEVKEEVNDKLSKLL